MNNEKNAAPAEQKLMPAKPTKEMLDAACLAWACNVGFDIDAIYAAMLAAAPVAAVAPSDAKDATVPDHSEREAANAGELSNAEIYTLRRLIECAEKLDDRPRPMCRDCADEDGTCPNSGLECDMPKLFADAKALHNKLASQSPATIAAGQEAAKCRGCDPAGGFCKDCRDAERQKIEAANAKDAAQEIGNRMARSLKIIAPNLANRGTAGALLQLAGEWDAAMAAAPSSEKGGANHD